MQSREVIETAGVQLEAWQRELLAQAGELIIGGQLVVAKPEPAPPAPKLKDRENDERAVSDD